MPSERDIQGEMEIMTIKGVFNQNSGMGMRYCDDELKADGTLNIIKEFSDILKEKYGEEPFLKLYNDFEPVDIGWLECRSVAGQTANKLREMNDD